jgi:hypothetical protein
MRPTTRVWPTNQVEHLESGWPELDQVQEIRVCYPWQGVDEGDRQYVSPGRWATEVGTPNLNDQQRGGGAE